MQTKVISVKKGFDLNLEGKAISACEEAPRFPLYSIRPECFHGVVPKLLVKEGTSVKVGDPIFCSKQDPSIIFTSSISGVVSKINRGDKRRILSIDIKADASDQFKQFTIDENNSESIQNLILDSGCWSFIKKRPYDIIADPNQKPKSIFISTYSTAPLSPDLEFIMADRIKFFQKGIDVLNKLVSAPIHLAVEKEISSIFSQIKGVSFINVSGPHPAGNVSVHINQIDPLNPGETIWTISPQDLAIIGELFETGQLNLHRKIAVVGAINNPKYYKTPAWTIAEDMLKTVPQDTRLVSGNVLTGTKIESSQSIGFYDHTLTLISEEAKESFLPYLPILRKNFIPINSNISLYKYLFKKKAYKPSTQLHGEERAFTNTGEMEKVFPFDIYPMYLLKAALAKDIEKMENLGIYEVAPEDFGLIDYVCSSKINTQQIIREGLDLMIDEVG